MIFSKLKILVFILFCSLYSSQSFDDIYLEIPNATYHIKDKKIVTEIYRLNTENCNNDAIKYSVGDNNRLIRTIIVKSSSKPTIVFTYNSFKNCKKKFFWNKEFNFIKYKELINTDLNNLNEVLKKYKNVYIVDKKNNAKKVNFEFLSNL